MGLIELASGNSLWRGYDYYEAKMVKEAKKLLDAAKAYEIEEKKRYFSAVDVATALLQC